MNTKKKHLVSIFNHRLHRSHRFFKKKLSVTWCLRVFGAVFFLLPIANSFSQITAPKYSNEFLSIGVGARALGMSNVQVALVNDVTAGYWNPAGLLNIKEKYEISLMHSEYFAGIAKYDYGAFATRIDSTSYLAVSMIRFGIDDIPNTLNLMQNNYIDYSKITYFSAVDYAFLFSYAKKAPFLEGLNLGANFKIIHRSVGNFANAWGFGIDAGAQLEHKGWKFGLMGRDITTTFNAWTHNAELIKETYKKSNNEIPENSIEVTLPKFLLGAGKEFNIYKEKISILTAMDLDLTIDGKRNVLIKSNLVSIDPHLGFELDYKKIVFLRFGVGNYQRIKDYDYTTYPDIQPNFGIGLKISNFTIDYALTDIGDQSEALFSNVFSLKIGLN